MIKKFFEEYKGARRLLLLWSMWLITVVVLRVTEKDILLGLTSSSATVIVSVIGILTTVIGFYQWHRSKDKPNDS